MSGLEIITAVVLSNMTQGIGKIAAAPLAAAAGELEARIRSRLARIGQSARDKAGERPIEASDRVLHKVLTEGAFADDEVILEYLGGVLAASDESDSAASVVAAIGRLSAIQLRRHYILYTEVRNACLSVPDLSLYDADQARGAEIVIDAVEVMSAFHGIDWNDIGSALGVLTHEGFLTTYALRANEGGKATLTATPNGHGAELYLWGQGVRPPFATRIFEPGLSLHPIAQVERMTTTRLVRSLEPAAKPR